MTGSLVAELPEDVERERAACEAAWARYDEFLKSTDLSDAGDLLAFFGYDFFHDAAIENFTIGRDAESVIFEVEAWVSGDYSDETGYPDDPRFTVEFSEVAQVTFERNEAGCCGLQFLYAEIDGLGDAITSASARRGGAFHSLTIQCDEAWLTLVFRSVRVVPQDPVAWMQLVRDPRAKLALWALQSGQSDGDDAAPV